MLRSTRFRGMRYRNAGARTGVAVPRTRQSRGNPWAPRFVGDDLRGTPDDVLQTAAGLDLGRRPAGLDISEIAVHQVSVHSTRSVTRFAEPDFYRSGRRRTLRERRSAEMAAPSLRAAAQVTQIEPIRSACSAAASPSMRSRMTGGAAFRGDSQMRVKVVVQRHADTVLEPGCRQNLGIFGPVPSNLHYMHGVKATRPQDRRRTGRESLVQQECDHATRSIPRLSSSTDAAA
jgi:hypothetical protein